MLTAISEMTVIAEKMFLKDGAVGIRPSFC